MFTFIRESIELSGKSPKTLEELVKLGSRYKSKESFIRDLKSFFEIPFEDSQYNYFTHVTRGGNKAIDSILKTGIQTKYGLFSDRIWAVRGEVRDRAPYVVFRLPKSDTSYTTGTDRDHVGAKEFTEYMFNSDISPKSIVRAVKYVGATNVLESQFVKFALSNQGLDDTHPDYADTPDYLRPLFNLDTLVGK